MFETENSIEPALPQYARPKEQPIREATPADLIAATKRRTQAPDEPIKVERQGWFQRASKQTIEPDAVSKTHGLYVSEKRNTRVYFADYQQKSEVMRAAPAKISTKLSDRQTVTAMLDLAQSRGWDKVKLRGTEEFKREAWVQAQVRGIMTEGYMAKDTDKQEVSRRKQAAGPAEAVMKAVTSINVVAAKDAAKAPVIVKEREVQTDAHKPKSAAAPKRVKINQVSSDVWGNVEAVGAKMRGMETSKQSASEKPKAAVTVS